jgi:Lrp/AsnC family leucine-responsive transcriptional regulator
LQTDSKDNEKLSLKLNLSVTAVYERIKKLEREGIDKYVVLLNKAKVEKVCRFLSPKTNPTHQDFVRK